MYPDPSCQDASIVSHRGETMSESQITSNTRSRTRKFLTVIRFPSKIRFPSVIRFPSIIRFPSVLGVTVSKFLTAVFLSAVIFSVTACGATTDGEMSTDSSPGTTDVAENVSDPASTDAPETSTPTEVQRGLQLDQLPGRIAMNSIGCSNDIFENVDAVCIFDPDGTDLVQVDVPGEFPTYLSWTWDGSALLFTTTDESWVVNSDGTGLAERDALQVPMLTQSPDGKWSVGTLWGEDGFWLSPAGSPRDNRQWQQVTSDPNECCEIARWSPDSRQLLYSMGFGPGVCSGLSSTDIETKTVQTIVGPESSVAGTRVCAITESARWSPDGTTVLFLDEGPDLDVTVARPMLVNADGTNLRPLFPDAMANDTSVLPSKWFITAAAWSPDGTAIALALVHEMGGGLYIVSADGSEFIAFEDLPSPLDWMAWAPGL